MEREEEERESEVRKWQTKQQKPSTLFWSGLWFQTISDSLLSPQQQYQSSKFECLKTAFAFLFHKITITHKTIPCTGIHLRLLKVLITRKPNMIWWWNLHPSTSLAEAQKTLEAHGSKPWVTNLSIVPRTLGILTANITCCTIFPECVNESRVNANVV